MSTAWKRLSPRRQSLIKQAAGVLLVSDLAASVPSEAEERPVTFRDLRGWLSDGPGPTPPSAVRRALAGDARLRQGLDRLVRQSAVWTGPRASAASTGRLEAREGEGFRVRLQPSRGGRGQVYVQIELTDGSAKEPSTLVICAPPTEYVRLGLPRPQSGVIQILTDETADLPRLLRDPKAELYLW